MRKLVCSLAAGLMLVNGTATAHSWYPHECCSENDCHPVPCAELVLTPEGDVKWKGVLYFQSPDGSAIACRAMPRLRQGGLERECDPLSAAVRFRPARDELSAKAVSRALKRATASPAAGRDDTNCLRET